MGALGRGLHHQIWGGLGGGGEGGGLVRVPGHPWVVLGCYEGGFWVTQHSEVTVDVLGCPMSGFGAFKGGFWGTQWGGGF